MNENEEKIYDDDNENEEEWYNENEENNDNRNNAMKWSIDICY